MRAIRHACSVTVLLKDVSVAVLMTTFTYSEISASKVVHPGSSKTHLRTCAFPVRTIVSLVKIL